MNTSTTAANKNLFTSTAMLLDLALGNGGKANKALRTAAAELINAVFTGTVTPAVVAAATLVNTKNSSAEIVALFSQLIAVLR